MISKLLCILLLIALLWAGSVGAQDLQPRAFSPAPIGMNTVLLGYSFSSGSVFFDQALSIDDATGDVNALTTAYVRTFGTFGKLAKFTAMVPYAFGDWQGMVNGAPAATSREGFADPMFQLAVNFVGAPAVKLQDFRSYTEHTVAGASLSAIVPLGQYDATKLINLGSDRWAIRPRVGISRRMHRVVLEAIADVWAFSDIENAFGGTTISQAPIWSVQANMIYIFTRGIWGSVSGGLALGGQTTVNGVEQDNDQERSQFAATLSLPVRKRVGLRFFYINSLKTELGSDFNYYNVSVQYSWGGGL